VTINIVTADPHHAAGRPGPQEPRTVPTKTRFDPEAMLPLTPLSFHILLALADDDRHGYGIIKEVRERTNGEVNPGAGTLYAAVQRMLDDGLITETADRPAAGDDERRRYYRLSALGRQVARAEALRLARVIRIASDKKLIPELRFASGQPPE
jgi:DNA-binding PadR family transcriptional regulator